VRPCSGEVDRAAATPRRGGVVISRSLLAAVSLRFSERKTRFPGHGGGFDRVTGSDVGL